jgi:hypothetical protein
MRRPTWQRRPRCEETFGHLADSEGVDPRPLSGPETSDPFSLSPLPKSGQINPLKVRSSIKIAFGAGLARNRLGIQHIFLRVNSTKSCVYFFGFDLIYFNSVTSATSLSSRKKCCSVVSWERSTRSNIFFFFWI